MEGIFISIADIQLIHNCSYITAWRKMQVIRDSLSKERHQGITIKEFCDWEGISIDEFRDKKEELYKKHH